MNNNFHLQITRRSATRALLCSALLYSAAAHAAWPERPIRIVIPSSPGGSADALGRLVGERLGRALGQPVIIENRGGGGGNIATENVAKAAPDGYSLLMTGNNHPLNVLLFARAPYKLEDFVPVIELTRGPSVFVAAKKAPFSTLQQLISQAKAKPDSIAFGSPGIGLPSHIAFELFQHDQAIKLVHAPYKGSGPSLADVMGGQIPLVTSTLAAAMPNITAGKVQALAVTSAKRWPSLPDVPTVAEITGTPYRHLTWLGILAPRGTPAAVVTKLNTEFNKALQDPELRRALATMGTDPVGGSAEDFGKMIDRELESSKALIRDAGLRAD